MFKFSARANTLPQFSKWQENGRSLKKIENKKRLKYFLSKIKVGFIFIQKFIMERWRSLINTFNFKHYIYQVDERKGGNPP